MACNCGCSYNNLPCCCPTGEVTPCPTTVCPDAQPCNLEVESECVIYNGKDYECAGITTGMTVAEVVDVIIHSLHLNCTTTTTTTTSTTTTTTSTSTTTSTTSTTSTTTTTTLKPGVNSCNPIILDVTCNCNYQTFNNSGPDHNIYPPVPSCNPSGYLGNDIWFVVTVPTSGEVLISTQALQITDGVFSVYVNNSGLCNDLTELTCVDDGQGYITMPETHLTALTPGDILWIRFWGYGGYVTGQIGTFGICVNDPTCCDPSPINGSASACITTTTTSTTSTTTTTTTTTVDCSQSGGVIVPLEEFKMFATSITDVNFRNDVYSSTPLYVNWGDGIVDYFPTGTIPTTFHHVYSTPYTGEITVRSIDLSGITQFYDVSYIGSTITTTTIELAKLDAFQGADFVNLIITGDVKDLPRHLTYFVCWGKGQSSPITGNVIDLPRDLVWTNIIGQNTLYGDIADLPKDNGGGYSYWLCNILGKNTITGNTANLPIVGILNNCRINIQGFNTLTGDIANIPSSYMHVIFTGNNTIFGDISTVPSSNLSILFITGLNTITGDIGNLPAPAAYQYLNIGGYNTIFGDVTIIPYSGMETIIIHGFNTVSGDISTMIQPSLTYLSIQGSNTITGPLDLTLSTSLKYLNIRGFNTIGGTLAGTSVSTVLETLSITGYNTISGDIGDLPTTVKATSIYGNNTISAYTQPHSWFSPMNTVGIKGPIALSSAVIDNLVNDLDIVGMVSGSAIELKGVPTAASLAARNHLTSLGVVINITP